MSKPNNFEDEKCPICGPTLQPGPAIIDLETGKPLPAEHPVMQKMLDVWHRSTLAQREAFHRVCVHNSRDPVDLFLMHAITDQLK